MPAASSVNLAAALEYTRLGWAVFPLRPGTKRPLSARGFHDGTTDETQIRRWWAAEPQAGVGVVTGRRSNLVVFDVDPRHAGDETLRALVAQYGPLPETVSVATGGGGAHYYFLPPVEGGILPSVRGLWPGLDLKADGGYVAAPFSHHPSGARYRFTVAPDAAPLATLPTWISSAVLSAKEDLLRRAKVSREGAEESIFPEGSRNDSLTSLTGTLHRRGITYNAILAAMLIENERRCQPPLSEEEVKRIVDSVTEHYAPDPEAMPGVSIQAASGRLLAMVDVVQWASTEPPPIQWVFDGRLALGDCALLVGPDGAGKSWLALDLGVAGTTGRRILGRFQPEKKLRVLLIDEENPRDMVHHRLRNLVRAHNVKPEELDGQLFLMSPCQGFSFRDEDMVLDLTRKVEMIQPDVIVLDSVTALSNITNENDASAVRRFFHDSLYPIRSICNSTILLLHHPNKQIFAKDIPVHGTGVVRGSGDYAAAADAVLVLWPDPEATAAQGHRVSELRTEKVRRGKTPPPLRYRVVGGYDGGARPLADED